MRHKKIKGGEFVTKVANENVLDREEEKNTVLTNVTIVNMSVDRIHVVINGGDELPLDSGETMTLGDLAIDSIVVVESGSIVRYMGVE